MIIVTDHAVAFPAMSVAASSSTDHRSARAAVAPPRALILDVDGTLYAQPPVRLAMAWRLARATARSPREGVRSWRVLSAYRSAQEALRGQASHSAGDDQLRVAATRCGVDATDVRACVERWMHVEPGDLLLRHRRPGLVELLRAARDAGVAIGVFSDYPAERKLAAMGLDGLIDVVRSAHDPAIGRFKPAPDGLLAVARALGVAPAECVYVGDRFEVDGVAAQAAGMPAFIVGASSAAASRHAALGVPVPDIPALAARLRLL